MGNDGACDHDSVQAAIDDAGSSPATTVIRVAANMEHTGQALRINDKNVILEGGYTSCAAEQPEARNTVLDGGGNGNRPVIRIHSGSDARIDVALHRLAIQNGATTKNYFICSESRRNGAGLNIRGRVQVTLGRTVVRDNTTSSGGYSGLICGTPNSNSGGGIYFDGEGFRDSVLRLERGASVVNNAAEGKGKYEHMYGQGGGIFCEAGRIELARATAIAGNRTGGEKSGDGGGLYLDEDCVLRSSAGGLAGGILFNESAQSGGGIFTVTARVRFTPDGTRPVVAGNRAADDGGGIAVYVERGRRLIMSLGTVHLSGNQSGDNGGGLHVGWWGATLSLENSVIAGNVAQGRGGGFYLSHADMFMRRSDDECPGSELDHCSRIENNHAHDHGGALAITRGEVRIGQTRIAGNSADGLGSVAWVRGWKSELHMQSVAIHGNHGSSRLFQLEAQSLTSLDWSTIAGNRGADNPPLQVFRVHRSDNERLEQNTRLRVRGSIVWEPGAMLVNRTEGTFTPSNCTIGHVPLADSGLSVGSRLYSVSNPRLRDPENGDLRLRASSPAIDYCSSGEAGVQPQSVGLFGNRRGAEHDAPTATPPNPGSGRVDLGAHEVRPGSS